MKNISALKLAGSSLVALALIIGSSAQAKAIETVEVVASDISVQTTINPADQLSIDAVLTAKASYESAQASYSAAAVGTKEAKKAYKVAQKAWQSLTKAQAKAKKQIGKTFKSTVSNAKRSFNASVKGNHNVSAKAEAKAAKNAAIASASVARNDALAAIKFTLEKPVKPAKI